MSKELKQGHPLLMVPTVMTMGVVIYTNGKPFSFPNEGVRQAIVANLPPGTGVSDVTVTNHGVYEYRERMPEPAQDPDDTPLYSINCLRNEARVFCQKYAKSDEEREAVRRFLDDRFGLDCKMPTPMVKP